MPHSTCFSYHLVDVRSLLWTFSQHPPCPESVQIGSCHYQALPISFFILSEN